MSYISFSQSGEELNYPPLPPHTGFSLADCCARSGQERTAVASLELCPDRLMPLHKPSPKSVLSGRCPWSSPQGAVPWSPPCHWGSRLTYSSERSDSWYWISLLRNFWCLGHPNEEGCRNKDMDIPTMVLTNLTRIWFSLSTIFFCFKIWDEDSFNPKSVPTQHQKEKERLGMAG